MKESAGGVVSSCGISMRWRLAAMANLGAHLGKWRKRIGRQWRRRLASALWRRGAGESLAALAKKESIVSK